MRKSLVLLFVLFALAISGFGQQHIVSFKSGIPAGFAAQVSALGGRVLVQHPVLAVVEGLTPTAASTLKARLGTAITDLQVDASFELDDVVGQPKAATPASATDPTAAYFFPYQWNMMAIHAPEAWAAGKLGSATTTVAVIDTGIDYNYPDLAGHVDLSRSISFAPTDDVLVDANLPPGTNHATDINFHGTHVAATIVSNGNVVAGVTSKVTLMAVKVLATDLTTGRGSGTLGMVLSGVLFAADHGADVANMSLGGGFYKTAAGQYVSLINNVFTYAQKKGMLIVVSAGNGAINMDHDGNLQLTYCAQQHVVCVAATGPTDAVDLYVGPWINIDAPSYYTNYGRSGIDVAAPGGNSGGYVWSACSQTTLLSDLSFCRTDTAHVYIVGALGTSMAAPHVTGLAAQLIDVVGKGRPALLKQRIKQSADDLGQPGTDPFYGAGRINVANALGVQ